MGISFSRGFTEHELKVMLEGLSRASPKMIDHIFWQRFSAEQRIIHIEFKQVHYTEMEDPGTQARVRKKPGEHGRTIPKEDSSIGGYDQSRLGLDDLSQIQSVMRCLVTAVSSNKFYPSESKVIADSFTQLMAILNNILSERPVLGFARVGSSILVNGDKVDTDDFKQVADSFLKLLETVNLKSLTFLKHISSDELRSFIGALGELPTDGLDDGFWRNFARDKGLTRIIFNQHLYEILVEQTGMGTATDQSAEVQCEGFDKVSGRITPASEDDLATEVFTTSDDDYVQPEAEHADSAVEDFADDSLEGISGRIKDLLLEGDEEKIYRILHRLFQGFESHVPEHRRKVIHICRDLSVELSRALEHRLAKLLADPLMGALSGESDPDILEETVTLLSHIATTLIEFGEYALASRIFSHLHQVHRELEDAEHEHAQRLATLLNREPDRTTQELLMENLTSDEPSRQQDAVQLLSNMGRAAVPILIDTIKGEEKLTARKLAANLLKELGPEAVKLLRDQLVLGNSPEERRRVLEVIATATCDLHTELACALGDEDHQVRQAAFRLAQHMKDDDQVVEILLEHAQCGEVELAVSAIRCLGKLGSASAERALLSMMKSSKETQRLVACCRALGEIGGPASVEALAKLLEPGKLLSLRKKRSELIRATAAFALARIDDSQAKEVLATYVDDPEPRVRRIARKLSNNKELVHIQQRTDADEQG
jgi:HEAT repeat protein